MPIKPYSPYTRANRVISLIALADYFGVHRHTMKKRTKEFGNLDLRNTYDVFDFIIWYYENYGPPEEVLID